MSPDQYTDAVNRARDALVEFATVRADGRNRVRYARRLGISTTEIAALSGLSRNTVDRYLRTAPLGIPPRSTLPGGAP